MRHLKTLLAATALAMPIAASAQETPPKWDVANPPGMKQRQIPIDVREGTWMDVDVSGRLYVAASMMPRP